MMDKMKRAILWAVMLGSLCFLSACHPSSGLDSGIVVRKVHTPAHRIYSPVISIAQGRTRVMPFYRTTAEKWEILVQSGARSDWWSVDEEYYSEIEIGDRAER